MNGILGSLLAALLGLSHAHASDLSFKEAHQRALAQPKDLANTYGPQWDAFNNSNHLDEKDGCYRMSFEPVNQVLVLDKTGLVTDVIAETDNAKSRCFRKSYLNVKFPAPPKEPYYMYLEMQ